MEEISEEQCYLILAQMLDENTLRKFKKKHQDNFDCKIFIRDLYELICDALSDDFDQESELLFGKLTFSQLVLRISALFSSHIFFETLVEYLNEVSNGENYSKCLKICKIFAAAVQNCSCDWILGINHQFLETSDLEKSRKNVVDCILLILNLIDLMPLNVQQLRSHPKLKLFPRILELCRLILGKIAGTIQNEVLRNFRLSVLKLVSCKLVMICAQQIGNQQWVIVDSKKVCVEILQFLVTECGGENVIGLLTGQRNSLFPSGLLGNILEKMKLFMTKDKLTDFPVAIHILVWSISSVKHPFLGEHISMVLPPLLMLLDDYRVENRVIAIESLSHLIDNTNTAELRWYGRADMIYDALHHRIRTNEPEMMKVLQPCLVMIIKVIEPTISESKMNKCDENFQIILMAMEYESKILMRRAYCSNLVLFIDHMGITVVKHFKRLFRVIFGYLGIGDGESEEWRIVMLDVLKCALVHAWPRIPNHADEILRCLMKLVIDVSMSSLASSDVKSLMYEKIEGCLVVMLCVCGEPVETQLKCMTSDLGHRDAEELITRALNSANQLS